jgi:hypothetical protein
MTATATAPMIHHLQLIMGLSFETSNIFWPSPIGMQCHSVCIKVRLNASVLNFVHKSVHPLCLSITASKQWLLYGNSRVKIDQYHHKVCAYLDQHGLTGDIVKVIGPMFKEQKLFYTNLFIAGVNALPAVAPANLPAIAPPGIASPVITPPVVDLFKPIGCIATRALGAAGWDGWSQHHSCYEL